MTDDKTYLSKEKLKELQIELEDLKTVKRKDIIEKLEYAKSLGDLSENAEYQEAREAQGVLEDRIAVLEGMLKSAVIVSHKQGDTVSIGSTVTLAKKGSNDTVTYEIVGSEESDVANKKISNRSPLGESLMGKKTGETFTFEAPGGEVTYTIKKIG
jgi:transcription elongation factor GreA